MRKLALTLALAGFIGAGIATPAMACKDGKCKMEHSDKSKNGKKATAKMEECSMGTASAGETKSCCMKKDASQAKAAEQKKDF